MAQVSVHEARNNLSRLIKDVQAGEEVIIASHGKPVARLVPVESAGGGLGAWLLANPPSRGRTKEEIDAYLAAERDSWE